LKPTRPFSIRLILAHDARISSAAWSAVTPGRLAQAAQLVPQQHPHHGGVGPPAPQQAAIQLIAGPVGAHLRPPATNR
jgi:hypothetical protein